MQDQPVALVTGANQGIGLQIVKDLAAKGLTVLLGSRDLERGKAADAARYAALKRHLAGVAEDGDAYTRGKTDLIQELTDRARIDRERARIAHHLDRREHAIEVCHRLAHSLEDDAVDARPGPARHKNLLTRASEVGMGGMGGTYPPPQTGSYLLPPRSGGYDKN